MAPWFQNQGPPYLRLAVGPGDSHGPSMALMELIVRCGWSFYALVIAAFCAVMRSGGIEGLVEAIRERETSRLRAGDSVDDAANVEEAAGRGRLLGRRIHQAAQLSGFGFVAWLVASLAHAVELTTLFWTLGAAAVIATIVAIIRVAPFVAYVWQRGWPTSSVR